MLNSIQGTLTEKDSRQAFILTHGIEWDITISQQTYDQLPETGAACKLYLYLYHREDRMQLFGFHSTRERDLFFNLIKVDGIGPAQGMKILSGITPHEFIKALETNNVSRLEKIKGLGKKTAQKIILKLAGTLSLGEKENKSYGDIVKALSGMGFDAREARDAVNAAGADMDEEAMSKDEFEKKLLKAALEKLSKEVTGKR
jgi:holliday junction DNA helicase RuvA